jgi:hypothetical protein
MPGFSVVSRATRIVGSDLAVVPLPAARSWASRRFRGAGRVIHAGDLRALAVSRGTSRTMTPPAAGYDRANSHYPLHMSDIATKIHKARQARGLSQERLARLADCATISVRHFERGLVPTRSKVLPRVLEVLGLDPDPDT